MSAYTAEDPIIAQAEAACAQSPDIKRCVEAIVCDAAQLDHPICKEAQCRESDSTSIRTYYVNG